MDALLRIEREEQAQRLAGFEPTTSYLLSSALLFCYNYCVKRIQDFSAKFRLVVKNKMNNVPGRIKVLVTEK